MGTNDRLLGLPTDGARHALISSMYRSERLAYQPVSRLSTRRIHPEYLSGDNRGESIESSTPCVLTRQEEDGTACEEQMDTSSNSYTENEPSHENGEVCEAGDRIVDLTEDSSHMRIIDTPDHVKCPTLPSNAFIGYENQTYQRSPPSCSESAPFRGTAAYPDDKLSPDNHQVSSPSRSPSTSSIPSEGDNLSTNSTSASFSAISQQTTPKPRSDRRARETAILEVAFLKNPSPTSKEIQKLATDTQLSPASIKTFFSMTRRTVKNKVRSLYRITKGRWFSVSLKHVNLPPYHPFVCQEFYKIFMKHCEMTYMSRKLSAETALPDGRRPVSRSRLTTHMSQSRAFPVSSPQQFWSCDPVLGISGTSPVGGTFPRNPQLSPSLSQPLHVNCDFTSAASPIVSEEIAPTRYNDCSYSSCLLACMPLQPNVNMSQGGPLNQ